jgi:hypothetical protein
MKAECDVVLAKEMQSSADAPYIIVLQESDVVPTMAVMGKGKGNAHVAAAAAAAAAAGRRRNGGSTHHDMLVVEMDLQGHLVPHLLVRRLRELGLLHAKKGGRGKKGWSGERRRGEAGVIT